MADSVNRAMMIFRSRRYVLDYLSVLAMRDSALIEHASNLQKVVLCGESAQKLFSSWEQTIESRLELVVREIERRALAKSERARQKRN